MTAKLEKEIDRETERETERESVGETGNETKRQSFSLYLTFLVVAQLGGRDTDGDEL